MLVLLQSLPIYYEASRKASISQVRAHAARTLKVFPTVISLGGDMCDSVSESVVGYKLNTHHSKTTQSIIFALGFWGGGWVGVHLGLVWTVGCVGLHRR